MSRRRIIPVTPSSLGIQAWPLTRERGAIVLRDLLHNRSVTHAARSAGVPERILHAWLTIGKRRTRGLYAEFHRKYDLIIAGGVCSYELESDEEPAASAASAASAVAAVAVREQ